MKLLNRLNGWQRVYVFVCIILAIMASTTITIPPIYTSYSTSEFLPKLPAPLEADEDDEYGFSAFLERKTAGKNRREYVMPDGVSIYEDKRHSQQEVEYAYKQAQNKEVEKHRRLIMERIFDVLISYLMVIGGIYLLGWMIGWIRLGFKNR